MNEPTVGDDRGHYRGARIALWCAALALLLLPAVAMRFSAEVDWSLGDFLVFGLMLGSASIAVDRVLRYGIASDYRLAVMLAVATAFLLVWADLAVGLFAAGMHPLSLLFLGALAIASAAAAWRRFRADALARVLWALAAAHLLLALIALAGGWEQRVQAALFHLAAILAWMLAGALFRRAATHARV